MQVKEYFDCVKGFGDNRSSTSKEVRWMKPVVGWLKLNTDGSMMDDSGVPGCGGLITGSNRLWITGFAKPTTTFFQFSCRVVCP